MEKNLKNLVAFVMVAVLICFSAVSMTGCGSGTSSDNEAEVTTEETTEAAILTVEDAVPLALSAHLERAQMVSGMDHYDMGAAQYSITDSYETSDGEYHVEGEYSLPSTTSNVTFDSYFSMDINLENRTADCKSKVTHGEVDF